MSTLLGWWKGENDAVDSVNGMDATWNCVAAYSSGHIGQALDNLHGATSTPTLWVPDNALFNFQPTDMFSMEFWFRFTEVPVPNNWIIFVGRSSIGAHADWAVGRDSGSHKICFIINNVWIDTSVAVIDNLWHKILFTYNYGIVHVYVDDVDATVSPETPYFIPSHSSNPLCFFYSASTTKCLLDELKIYDDSGLGKKTLRFYDRSKGLIASTDFDFGDGSAHATELPVDHEYDLDTIGSPYTVDATLTATGSKGQTDSITKTIDLAGA